MTPEEMQTLIEALSPKLNETINAAVTSHTKRIQKDFDAKLSEFAKVSAPTQAPEATEAPTGNGKKLTPEFAAMEAKLADTLKRFEEADKARANAEDRARNTATLQQLKEALKGVRPDMVDIAAERLFQVQKRISWDENGDPLFKVKRAPVPGMAEEEVELPLVAGVEQWLKTKDANPFVSAPAAGGPGGRGGKSPMGAPTSRTANGMPKYDTAATTDDEKVARATEAERALTKAMENAGF